MDAKVYWFSDTKGFGLLKTSCGQDFIIHYSLIKNLKGWKTLKKGQKVKVKLSEDKNFVSEVRV